MPAGGSLCQQKDGCFSHEAGQTVLGELCISQKWSPDLFLTVRAPSQCDDHHHLGPLPRTKALG